MKKEVAKSIAFEALERDMERWDKQHGKKPIPYPKGSLEEAVDKAVNTLGGYK